MIFEPTTLKTLLYILLLSLLPLKIVFNCLLVEDIFNANWIYFAIYKEIFEIICIFEMNFNRTVYQIFSKIRKDMTNFNACPFNFVWKINLYNVLFEKSFPTIFSITLEITQKKTVLDNQFIYSNVLSNRNRL